MVLLLPSIKLKGFMCPCVQKGLADYGLHFSWIVEYVQKLFKWRYYHLITFDHLIWSHLASYDCFWIQFKCHTLMICFLWVVHKSKHCQHNQAITTTEQTFYTLYTKKTWNFLLIIMLSKRESIYTKGEVTFSFISRILCEHLY